MFHGELLPPHPGWGGRRAWKGMEEWRGLNSLGGAVLLSPEVCEAVASNLIKLSQFCSFLFY